MLLSVASLLLMSACDKEIKKRDSDIVTICIDYNNTDKNQKIYINSTTDNPFIGWQSGDQLSMRNSDESINVLLSYLADNSDTTANFSVPEESSLTNGSYIALYPATASPSTIFTIPNKYEISNTDLNAYINNQLLMYTKTPYVRGTDNYAKITPVMTVLEIPLSTPTGTLIIDTIKLYAGAGTNAFIKSATLPDLFTSTTLTNISYTDSMVYVFPTPLILTTTAQTVRLLIWSNELSNPGKYSICINGNRSLNYYTRNASRTTAFLNSTYYVLPTLNIPQPVKGDFYQGGYVVHTAIEENVTHCYIAALADQPAQQWGPSEKITTNTALGSGLSNTNNISNYDTTLISAASASLDYAIDHFNDWYLPSQDEHLLIYNALSGKSGALEATRTYWTSCSNGNNKNQGVTIKGITVNTKEKKTALYQFRPMRNF